MSRYELKRLAQLEQIRRAHRRDEVQNDDVLDALVAYVTASRAMTHGTLQSVCSAPTFDTEGLPMEMLYAMAVD